MKKLPSFLFRCSLVAFAPVAANAAGTYYNGGYQSPQQARYNNNQGYVQRQGNYTQNSTYTRTTGYMPSANNNNGGYAGARYNAGNWQSNGGQAQQQQPKKNSAQQENGFHLDAGISRQTAQWQFEMNESGSILHYDNVAWNVLDVTGGYSFDMGNTPLEISAGLQYGMQSGESPMVDDDITNGGYFVTQWVKVDENDKETVIGNQIGHALSVGTSKGGNMMGFNLGLGFTDAFKWGNVRLTPSIGYRYLKYKLETSKNYGMAIDTAACFQINGTDEIQCDPAVIGVLNNGQDLQILWRDKLTDKMEIVNSDGQPISPDYIDVAGTYYWEQNGVSHRYEAEWAGPYVALDMLYEITKTNAVTGRVELGLPSYTATGDQPYRYDWQHPKSVEDKAGIGSAWHFGLGANWLTAITDTMSLTVGFTYDYYNVKDADAKTYLSGSYYNELYKKRLEVWQDANYTEDQMLGNDPNVNGDAIAMNIKELESQCTGWVCSANSEVKSFYKSMGIRVGINAKF